MDRPEMPAPPHPRARQEPLPECRAKPGEEDPDAPARVEAILRSPSYQRADRDVEFLERQDARALRLHLDYLKPELLLGEHRVEHTIVVFGSTRVVEPAVARRRVAVLSEAAASDPHDAWQGVLDWHERNGEPLLAPGVREGCD